MVTNGPTILSFSNLQSGLPIQEERFLWKSNASFSSDIHNTLIGHATSTNPPFQGSQGGRNPRGWKFGQGQGGQSFCDQLVWQSSYDRFNSQPFLAPYDNHFSGKPHGSSSPYIPHLPRDAFSDPGLIFLVKFVKRLGKPRYNVVNNSTILSQPLICRTPSLLSRLVRFFIQCGILTTYRRTHD